MTDFECMEQRDVKNIIRQLAIKYKYEFGNEPTKTTNLNERIAIKEIDNEKLRKALYYVKEAKFKVYYGNLGKQSYNVFINKVLLKAILEAFDLTLEVEL